MAPGSGWPARSQAHARPHLAIRLGHPAAAAAAAALVSLPTRRAIVAAAAAEEIRTWDRDDNEFLQSTAWTTAYSTYVMLFRAVRRSALCTPLLFLHIYRCAWRYNLDFTLNLMIQLSQKTTISVSIFFLFYNLLAKEILTVRAPSSATACILFTPFFISVYIVERFIMHSGYYFIR